MEEDGLRGSENICGRPHFLEPRVHVGGSRVLELHSPPPKHLLDQDQQFVVTLLETQVDVVVRPEDPEEGGVPLCIGGAALEDRITIEEDRDDVAVAEAVLPCRILVGVDDRPRKNTLHRSAVTLDVAGEVQQTRRQGSRTPPVQCRQIVL